MHDGSDPLTTRTLAILAPLMAHILTRIGGIKASHGAPTTAAWEAPLPINQDAFDDANWLWTVLTETVIRVATSTGSTVPDVSRTVWRNQAGKTVGLPKIDVTAGTEATATLTRWLTYNATPGDLAWLHEATTEIAPRHPLKDRPRVATEARCEADAGTLIIKPPRWYGDEQVAACQTCGATYSEAQLQETVVRWHAIQAAERVHARAERARAHLAKKYGRVE